MLVIKEAEAFDWCRISGITQHIQTLTYSYIGVIPAVETNESFKLFQRTHQGDKEILKNDLQFALNIFGQIKKPTTKNREENTINIGIKNFKDFYIVTESGKLVELKNMILTVRYFTNEKFSLFTLHDYRDEVTNTSKQQIATAKLDLGSITGEVVITYGSEGGKVFLIANNVKKNI